MTQNVDLNRMQIFNHVVNAGSFSKAAAALHQPKSRISRNIAALERELGVQLIYRTTRQFRLTEAGMDLFERALGPLNELAHVLENIHGTASELSGKLRVTAPEDLGVVLVTDVCRAFMEIHPKVHIDLHLSSELLDIGKDWIDVAIRIGRLKDSSLMQKKFGSARMGFYLSPSLRKELGSLTKLEDLESVPYLAFAHTPGNRQKLKVTNGRSEKILKANSIFTANNLLVIRRMATQGMGLAMFPQFLIQEELRQGALERVFPEWGSHDIPIQIVSPMQAEPLPRVRRFVEFAASRLAPYFG